MDSSSPSATTARRLDSIDIVRGVVMAIMLLDHVRDFTNRESLLLDPLDLTRTNVPLFLTRWVTHFCAPVFVFLAGLSARLQAQRGMSARELSGWLVRRGALLVVMELVVFRPLIWLNFDPRLVAMLQVIWAIGWAMIVLAALVHGPRWLPGLVGVVILAGHNLLDRFEQGGQRMSFLWAVLHRRQIMAVDAHGEHLVAVMYPVLPWIGVLAAGYALGAVYAWDAERRRRALFLAGGLALALFVVVRWVNVYGDPSPWSSQSSALRSVLSFVNTQKYPPSLLYLAMTLGPALLALGALDGHSARGPSQAFVVLGRVPLFFYLLQWLWAHAAAFVLQLATGQPLGWQTRFETFFMEEVEGLGWSLWATYAAWIAGLIALWPLCAWYGAFKRRRRDLRWLAYF